MSAEGRRWALIHHNGTVASVGADLDVNAAHELCQPLVKGSADILRRFDERVLGFSVAPIQPQRQRLDIGSIDG